MNCDRIAPWYSLLEHAVFGSLLERCRGEHLGELAGVQNVLLLGDGDGRFTAEFARLYPVAAIESIDLSAGMLALARARLAGCGANVTLRQGDARSITLRGNYDLIVTHFFLDCFEQTEVQHLIERVAKAAGPHARWIVSEFQIPSSLWLRSGGALLVRSMYFFFRVATGLKTARLPEYAQLLRANGFRKLRSKSYRGGLLASELWTREEIVQVTAR